MSTHNICFHGEIRKIFFWYPLLSRPMFEVGTMQRTYKGHFLAHIQILFSVHYFAC